MCVCVKQVAADFAEFFSSNVLTSNKLWKFMIDGSRAEAFRELVAARVVPFVSRASAVAGANLDPVTVKSLAVRAAAKLGDHVHVLHDYTDKTLALRETMTVQMQKVFFGLRAYRTWYRFVVLLLKVWQNLFLGGRKIG